jgi:hypothetical protein
MIMLMNEVGDSGLNSTISDQVSQCIPRRTVFKKRGTVMVLFQKYDDYRLPITSFDRFGRPCDAVLECPFHR